MGVVTEDFIVEMSGHDHVFTVNDNVDNKVGVVRVIIYVHSDLRNTVEMDHFVVGD